MLGHKVTSGKRVGDAA